jgi:type I restriction enzyme M protein
VPACLLILSKDRPKERRDNVLLIYAARHYRELSNKNQLRPQDIMRILVHYHAYGDPLKASKLIAYHSDRLQQVVSKSENEEIARISAEYEHFDKKLAEVRGELIVVGKALREDVNKTDRSKTEKAINKLESIAHKLTLTLQKRDAAIAQTRKQASEDRQAIHDVGQELIDMYNDPIELGKHARVVEFDEVIENEFNLNIPRYVDTFVPEPEIDISLALSELRDSENNRLKSEEALRSALRGVGYAM